jgi:aspartate dehydrogenase
LGLDKTRGVLIADPSLKTAIAEVEAIGKNGGRMVTIKEQPVVGVSGTEMPAAILNSVLQAADPPPGFVFI